MSKKLKIAITIIIACIILIGIVITFTLGLNFGLIYSKNKEVIISIGKEFEIEDIKNIVREATNKDKMIIQKVELYEDIVSIKLEDITNEELMAINTKINEKYGIENSIDNLEIVENANVRLRDLIKDYIYPVILSFVVVIVYMVIYMLIMAKMGEKLNVLKTMAKFILSVVIVGALFLSLIAIVRIPVNRLTVPISLSLYVLTTVCFMCKLENEHKKIENDK